MKVITQEIDKNYFKTDIVIDPNTFAPVMKIYIDDNFIDQIKNDHVITKIYTDSLGDFDYIVEHGYQNYKEPLYPNSGAAQNVMTSPKVFIDYYNKSEYTIMEATVETATRYIDILSPIENIDINLDKTSNSNLLWMCRRIVGRDMPIDKASRWLGYIQGVMSVKGYLSVDAERDHTRPIFHLAYKNANIEIPKTMEK